MFPRIILTRFSHADAKRKTSGIRGVHWDKKREKWVAQIGFKGKNYYLGRYEKKEDAADARKESEKYLYKDFLKWYAEAYPERWKKLQKNTQGRTKEK